MCGIFCHAGNGSAVADAGLRAVAHRGPDHSGVLERGEVSLGHRRLSIIDISDKGNQPMSSISGRTAISFNGEIYNYKELKQELIREGARFASDSDTEVILEGYERHGAVFFERMRGMWAFILHDRERGEVICARDPFGIKPLYYAMRGVSIYFASELKCFREAGIPLEPDSAGYPAFYNLGYFIAPVTPYKDVRKLIPGEVLSWNLEKKAMSRVRRISRFAERSGYEGTSYAQALDELDRALTESVEAHYVADVPVSILLSGGNDSSLIAALSAKLGKRPTAYHVSIPNSDDTQYAKKVAKELGLNLIIEELSAEALKNQYEKIWNVIDEPTGDISIIPTSLIYERIKGESKVVLSGEGGDELFGGYLRQKMLAKHTRISKTNSLNSFFNRLLSPSRFGLSYLNPLVQRLRSQTLSHGLTDDLIGAYLKSVRLADYPILDTEIRDSLFNLYQSDYDKRIPSSLAFDALAYLPNDLLQKCDISSMASSIEARVPFVDRFLATDVASVLATVDAPLATSGKAIMKTVLERYLPKSLVYRSKKGFGVPMQFYDTGAFVADFEKACTFHQAHREAFAVSDDLAGIIGDSASQRILARKYPRFAFALISNWKYFL